MAFSASFSFADERHDIIIGNYKETHPQVEGSFYTLNEIGSVNDGLNNAYLVLTGQELHDKNNRINELLQNSPNMHIILDVQEGDGLVENASLSLGQNLVENIRKLTILNIAQDVQIIGDDFLSRYIRLSDLDLTLLSQVRRIGSYFLYGCNGLAHIDLPPSVTHIKDSFLEGCASLTRLDLIPLSQVIHIGACFLKDCTELIDLDLSPLRQVVQIGVLFLTNCSKLTNLDLSSLSQLTQIKQGFLLNCSGLTGLDLSAFRLVIQIEQIFLYGCTGFAGLGQLILPAYNPILKASLEVTFPQGTAIGDDIRENYTEGYRLPSKNTKNAQN